MPDAYQFDTFPAVALEQGDQYTLVKRVQTTVHPLAWCCRRSFTVSCQKH